MATALLIASLAVLAAMICALGMLARVTRPS
jgi:hypothetical protein